MGYLLNNEILNNRQNKLGNKIISNNNLTIMHILDWVIPLTR